MRLYRALTALSHPVTNWDGGKRGMELRVQTSKHSDACLVVEESKSPVC